MDAFSVAGLAPSFKNHPVVPLLAVLSVGEPEGLFVLHGRIHSNSNRNSVVRAAGATHSALQRPTVRAAHQLHGPNPHGVDEIDEQLRLEDLGGEIVINSSRGPWGRNRSSRGLGGWEIDKQFRFERFRDHGEIDEQLRFERSCREVQRFAYAVCTISVS